MSSLLLPPHFLVAFIYFTQMVVCEIVDSFAQLALLNKALLVKILICFVLNDKPE